jgi:DNA-binding IclR family transcriptional regulator
VTVARPSPGAERVVAVLEFLAARPEDRFSLSELARGCRLNKATAHALLTELTTRGVLLRHPDEKRYSLGPRLIPVGRAAGHGYNVADFAGGVVRRLAASTGAHTIAVARDAADEYADAVEEAGGKVGSLPRRWPLVPPVGVLFFAWADAPSVEAWLARCPPGGSVHHALAALEVSRRGGLAIGDGVPAWWRLASLLAEPRSRTNSSSGDPAAVREALTELARAPALLAEVQPHDHYQPGYVAAPIFDHESQVVLTLVVGGLQGRSLPGRELVALAEQVQSAAEELTAAVHGRVPRPPP